MTGLVKPVLISSQALSDTFNREIDYLRISVTDRCNMRCLYCMPEDGIACIPRRDILRYEEIAHIVRATARLGIRSLRITGGEPLIRRDLVDLVVMLKAIPGIDDIALSTNAVLLGEHAQALAAAGLNRVNVSIDSLNPERFRKITRRDYASRALAGIAAAETAGLTPIKINCVAMRGANDDELAAIAALSIDHAYHVRFIEIMPLHGNEAFQEGWYMPATEILERVRTLGDLEQCAGPNGNGPARYWRLPGAKGTIGVISPLSHNYCETCNRVRLTADGQLRLCLFGDNQVDLRHPLRQGATIDEIAELVRNAIKEKPEHHNLSLGHPSSNLEALSQVGG
jgi:cyclic pyranopterin phosphate synthase